MIGSMLISGIEKKTIVRLKDVDNVENYNNAIDVDYDSEDVIFTGWLYNLNIPEYNKVNRPQYGKGTKFEQDIVDYTSNNCYIPTNGNCFIECLK